LIDKDSMLYWYPKIKHLNIPMPKTEILKIPHEAFRKWVYTGHNKHIKPYIPRIYTTAQRIGYPLFLRTDHASGKHDWKNSCYVPSEKVLIRHLRAVIEFNELADILGLPYKAIIFREFLDLDWKFKAFWGEMPVAKERRYFIKDGKVLCHHPYWIEDAILRPTVQNWKDILKVLNYESKEEIKILSSYAKMVSEVLDGYWSVDFAYGKNGNWYLIDMATGERSWHPECPIKKENGA